MACPGSVSLCFVAGSTITINWQWFQNDGVTPYDDLTGATAEMQLLNSVTDQSQVIDMTGGITEPTQAKGVFSLTAAESQSLLPVGSGDNPAKLDFVSQIRITFADSTVQYIAGANVEIKQGAVR